MKSAQPDFCHCLKFVKIAPEKYSDEEIELIGFDGYNSLACTNRQLKIMMRRMVGFVGRG